MALLGDVNAKSLEIFLDKQCMQHGKSTCVNVSLWTLYAENGNQCTGAGSDHTCQPVRLKILEIRFS